MITNYVTIRQAGNGQKLYRLIFVSARGVHPVGTFVRDNSPAALVATGKAYAAQRGFDWRPDLAVITDPSNTIDFVALDSQMTKLAEVAQ